MASDLFSQQLPSQQGTVPRCPPCQHTQCKWQSTCTYRPCFKPIMSHTHLGKNDLTLSQINDIPTSLFCWLNISSLQLALHQSFLWLTLTHVQWKCGASLLCRLSGLRHWFVLLWRRMRGRKVKEKPPSHIHYSWDGYEVTLLLQVFFAPQMMNMHSGLRVVQIGYHAKHCRSNLNAFGHERMKSLVWGAKISLLWFLSLCFLVFWLQNKCGRAA